MGQRNHLFGKPSWIKGRHWSDEYKEKQRIAHLGKKHSDASRKKMSASLSKRNVGMRWFNNGVINVFRREQPNGFIPGMLKRN